GFWRKDRREKRRDMAGPAPPPKQEELVPHPVKDQLPSVSFCITSPPPWRKSFTFLSYFSRLILIHLLSDEKARVVQTLLFLAGINTLLQTYFGTCLPAVMGGSYTFVAPTISIILAGRYSNIVDPHEVATRP
ncbi:hypothetical protein GW17_00017197, partial [Ensete ventricosum]